MALGNSSQDLSEPLVEIEAPIIASLGAGSCQELVDYYDKHLSPLLVWVDTNDNVFRRHIIPLARTHVVVRLALAAVSAQHSANARGDDTLPENARNEAIALIRDHITGAMGHLMNGDDSDDGKRLDGDAAEWLLASMLVLSSYEMAHSGATAADFHRKAARSLVTTVTEMASPQSMLFSFLRNKLATYDVFACTTSFDVENITNAILPDPRNEITVFNETALFSKYLRLIHEITLLTRSGDMQAAASRDWKAEFGLARGATLMAVGKLPLKPHMNTNDIIRLVDIHYHAALIYITSCLSQHNDPATERAATELLSQVQAMETIDLFLNSLPWPIFIVGIASHNNKERQVIVSDIYARIIRITGLRQYFEVLNFMNAFWSGFEPDWQVLARNWEYIGHPILPY